MDALLVAIVDIQAVLVESLKWSTSPRDCAKATKILGGSAKETILKVTVCRSEQFILTGSLASTGCAGSQCLWRSTMLKWKMVCASLAVAFVFLFIPSLRAEPAVPLTVSAENVGSVLNLIKKMRRFDFQGSCCGIRCKYACPRPLTFCPTVTFKDGCSDYNCVRSSGGGDKCCPPGKQWTCNTYCDGPHGECDTECSCEDQ
jgi:hypothetical protein